VCGFIEIDTILEWFYFADADFDSAQILNNAYRKHGEIIFYHCQQAVEKYLKAFYVIIVGIKKQSD